MSKEALFYRAEYENLRRKKNKKIHDLENDIDTLVTNVVDYLSAKGLINDYMQYMKGKKNVSN